MENAKRIKEIDIIESIKKIFREKKSLTISLISGLVIGVVIAMVLFVVLMIYLFLLKLFNCIKFRD